MTTHSIRLYQQPASEYAPALIAFFNFDNYFQNNDSDIKNYPLWNTDSLAQLKAQSGAELLIGITDSADLARQAVTTKPDVVDAVIQCDADDFDALLALFEIALVRGEMRGHLFDVRALMQSGLQFLFIQAQVKGKQQPQRAIQASHKVVRRLAKQGVAPSQVTEYLLVMESAPRWRLEELSLVTQIVEQDLSERVNYIYCTNSDRTHSAEKNHRFWIGAVYAIKPSDQR
ncbi:hypothetical protein [Psychrobacter sp. FDAARGOS_221]|uniref:hypothetical protein n=1 Tax=Psychrobacter sp. FDAARGOS_221 TaxID=1975705 RepID=UPI000BB576A9|nr:hypothetical protein [Psychrobacter sp. FDAARGOS_221]PNK60668.1 hypothetical protein A6J60_007140 [Psychrobacter sp. FDAARGOS_221]